MMETFCAFLNDILKEIIIDLSPQPSHHLWLLFVNISFLKILGYI